MNILITGSVLNSSEDSVKNYQELVDLLKSNNHNVISPLDTMQFKGNNVERYKRAMQSVEWADIIIAELTTPSTGQGMELQQAVLLHKKVLAIAKANSKISGLIQGSEALLDVLFYDKINDIKNKIIETLNQKGE